METSPGALVEALDFSLFGPCVENNEAGILDQQVQTSSHLALN